MTVCGLQQMDESAQKEKRRKNKEASALNLLKVSCGREKSIPLPGIRLFVLLTRPDLFNSLCSSIARVGIGIGLGCPFERGNGLTVTYFAQASCGKLSNFLVCIRQSGD
jgi:hypothetical protein